MILLDRQTLTHCKNSPCTTTASDISVYFQLPVTVCERCASLCSSSCLARPRSLPVGLRLGQSVSKYHSPGTAGLCLQSGDWDECTSSII